MEQHILSNYVKIKFLSFSPLPLFWGLDLLFASMLYISSKVNYLVCKKISSLPLQTNHYPLLTSMALGDDWPELLTVKEVAKILRVAPLTVKRWGKRGKLPAIRINSRGDRRYKKEAVLWLLGQQQPGISSTA
ncbi:MAG: helix-turn-helix domain-containing protein [Candidatus Curtissbacteria bacterium]|nr:helix-turn-helix domain-containing protein [Candidatus Curtissbacteria bacterium]